MSVKLDQLQVRNATIISGAAPSSNNSIDLGTSSYIWRNIYSSKFIGNLNGNADTASKMGASNATWLYFHNQNELNFGGTNNSTTIYLGYRAIDNRPIPTQFMFGGSTGTASLQCKTVYLGSGTSSYVSSTQYTGNAATATKISVTATNPASGTLYWLPFTTSGSPNSILYNDGIGYWTREGTTTDVGIGELRLGNNIATGTAGNKRGMIYIYGNSSGYTELIPTNHTTSNVIQYLPANGGYFTYKPSTAAVGSASLPVYSAASGAITACTPSSVFSNLSWTAGSTSGPVLNATVATQGLTATIPSASSSASGVVTTADQSFRGMKTVYGAIRSYMYNLNNNAPAFIFDKPGSYWTGIGANSESNTIQFAPCQVNEEKAGGWEWVANFNQTWKFQGNINASNNLTIGNTATIAGATTLSSTLGVAGATTLSSALSVTGVSTFTGNVTANGLFTYAGMEAGTADAARVIWFADSSTHTRPVYDTTFTWNPATKVLSAVARIQQPSGQNLYLGNSSNSMWVMTQDICSHNGVSNWAINVTGTAWFKKINGGYAYSDSGSCVLNITGESLLNGTVYLNSAKTAFITSTNYTGTSAKANLLAKTTLSAETIDNVNHVGLIYGTIGSYAGPGFQSSDAMIISASWNDSNNYGAQIGLDDSATPNMYVRNKSTAWSAWAKVLLSTNYTDYTVTKTGGGASGNSWAIGITGNAASSTYVGDSSMTLQAHYSNEVNFGGANESSVIYFGYRALGSKPIPAVFVFGGSTGSANLQCNTIYLGSGTSSYISSTQYTGNAATATNADTADGLHVHTGRNNEGNKIVRTDSNGYIQCGYINSSSGNEGNNSNPPRVWGTNGSDNYLRTYLTSALSVGYASSAGNADTVDNYHVSNLTTYQFNPTELTSATPAADAKTYFASTNLADYKMSLVYNNRGTEYAMIYSRAGSYGSILRWTYSNRYLQILRYYGGAWQSDDWEKIYAGYADSAGTASSATKATQDSDGNTINSTYLKLSGGTISGKLQVNGLMFGYNYGVGGNNCAAFIWDKPGSNYTGVGACAEADTIYFGACDANGAWVTSYYQKWKFNGSVHGSQVYGAVWNDYAEYRSAETIEPGRVVQESTDGIMKLTTCRLAAGCEIVSDTFGFAIGETDNCKTPIAASGRVLAYTFEDRDSFELGQAVCSGPNGTVSKMTREEIMMYPERIIGTVSEIPTYTTWGTGNVDVNGRIWIRIR